MAKHIDADAEAKKYLDMQLEQAKTEKFPDILTFVLVLIVIAAFAISFWILPDRDFSAEENRTLAEFPEFSVELPDKSAEDASDELSLSDRFVVLKITDEIAEFTADFATYMADQFPLRDQLVGLKGAAEIAMLRQENNSVMVHDGILAERFDSTNTENVEKNLAAIGLFTEACEEAEIDAAFAVLGRTMDIYDFPLYGTEATDTAWAKLDGADYIDLREPYKDRADEYVYYRTDHHYTTLGAYYAYEYLAPQLGYTANPLEHYERTVVSEEFYGTTYSKAGMKWIKPDTVELFRWAGDEDFTVTVADTGETHSGLYFENYLGEKDKYSIFLGGNYGRVDITANSGEEREKILIIKDSFAHALAPFLAEHYDVTMIDTRYFKRPAIRLAMDEGFDRVLVICNMDTLSSATPFDILRMGIR